MKLLDLFCGAGGAAMGYSKAGFEVIGVDHKPQPNYPFEFIQGDVLDICSGRAYLSVHTWGVTFDAVHASPPCQLFSAYQRANKRRREHLNLIPPTREMLEKSGLPYVIENVEGAPLHDPVLLCGSMFDLDVERHRLFETNWGLQDHSWPCRHGIWSPRFPASTNRREGSRRTVAIGQWSVPLERQHQAMGVDWMTLPELSQAIPPSYTEYIGQQLIKQLDVEGGSGASSTEVLGDAVGGKAPTPDRAGLNDKRSCAPSTHPRVKDEPSS